MHHSTHALFMYLQPIRQKYVATLYSFLYNEICLLPLPLVILTSVWTCGCTNNVQFVHGRYETCFI